MLDIKDEDLLIELARDRDYGGQHVGTPTPGIKVTHLPTRISVSCSDERSQLKNKEKALRFIALILEDYFS